MELVTEQKENPNLGLHFTVDVRPSSGVERKWEWPNVGQAQLLAGPLAAASAKSAFTSDCDANRAALDDLQEAGPALQPAKGL